MNKTALDAVALSIRSLSMDAVEAASSGHPGLPMGCAELGALLYGQFMKHDPADPDWIDRDRFVLSAGHGSMLLYSLLHLSGYGLTLEDLKNFRQLGSSTAGHPEYGRAAGIETTTGPLGQGQANAVGMAIAEQMLAAKFNTESHTIIDHYTYALSGDGCMMEGVTSEAASLAGHLGLGKLIVFYDSNGITIDGSTEIAFTEDVMARYQAYNWQTLRCDAYDTDAIVKMVETAKSEPNKPTLILLESVIGKGAPNLQGTSKIHGAALGADEIAATRKNLGLGPDDEFYVAPAAAAFFTERRAELAKDHADWQRKFDSWAEANPELKAAWDQALGAPATDTIEFPSYETGSKEATRNAGNDVLNACAAAIANLVGGSADLAGSNKTAMPDYGFFSREDRTGRTINFGVREHAMGSITNGIALHGGLRPFAATFMVFADYMRPPIRLASLMKLPVIYVFTHDSIYVGEDGPTHQPVEQMASLRVFPNMTLLRPADGRETAVAWKLALENNDGPTVLALTRQGLPVFDRPDSWQSDCERGAYVVRDGGTSPRVVIVATGSEVGLALEAAEKVGDGVRVVSMISRELFLGQDRAFRERIIPNGSEVFVAEAGVGSGWEAIASGSDHMLTIETFGESGKAEEVAAHLGLTAERLAEMVRKPTSK